MSIETRYVRSNEYRVKFENPELGWLQYVAKSLGLSESVILASSIHKGLCQYVDMCKRITEETEKVRQDANCRTEGKG